MSPDQLPEVSVADQEYSRLWAEATTHTLEQLQGSPVIPAPEGPAPAEKAAEAAGEGLTVLFKVSGRLAGEQAFQFLRTDGVRLAQLLMAESLDPAVAFTEAHADAVNEIFRQFAGLAATSCKTKFGGEVQFELLPGKTPEWKPVNNSIWTFSSEKIPALQWTMLFSPELHTALDAAHQAELAPAQPAPAPPGPEPQAAEASPPTPQADAPAPATPEAPAAPTPKTKPESPPAQEAAKTSASTPAQESAPAAPPPSAPEAAARPPQAVQPPPTTAVPPPPPPQAAPPPPPPPAKVAGLPAPPPPPPMPAPNPANLDLLLDVVLEATLRFGQKDMLLRDILELRPGSVVELNRRVQEPAELLVAGRVIARGEVVIVDGSYGLRITDLAQPHQRLESVET